MIIAPSRWLAEMSSQGCLGAPQGCQGGLRKNGLEQGGDQLDQEAPGAWAGQAALAQRGESSSSSINGSSRRIIKRWARR